jgi:hypothetical protein
VLFVGSEPDTYVTGIFRYVEAEVIDPVTAKTFTGVPAVDRAGLITMYPLLLFVLSSQESMKVVMLTEP